ncbi:MAG: UDP-N-acetylmuramate:L-alanyl-gamma-D-glutamyl-meso-diaminopimelate ligase, partial [Pseudomonadales bacterium]
MHIHFLGIGGTLMGNLALLAQEAGHEVSGSDDALYPPMSDVLENAGIEAEVGWDPESMREQPDLVVIGNAGLPRGNPAVEYVLDEGIPYTSGAQFLGDNILVGRWVIAVAGTHGKTTSTSMVVWILESAGCKPGFLIGGVSKNLDTSARLGKSGFFVVEADEYDTSYFDRRSKFVHYRPRTLIVNNLEYDHADIFPDLAAIQTQFHHLLRAVPSNGLVVAPQSDDHVHAVLRQGCWTPIERFANTDTPRVRGLPLGQDNGHLWMARNISTDESEFDVCLDDQVQGHVRWSLMGRHNITNALGAIAAARHAGVPPATAIEALSAFQGAKRRLEFLADVRGVCVYDDFAHHPTAIRATLQALRNRVGGDEIIAIIEPRSHTMRLGTLRNELVTCCAAADSAIWYRPENLNWDITDISRRSVVPATVEQNLERLIRRIATQPPPIHGKRHIVIMSNGSFGGIQL